MARSTFILIHLCLLPAAFACTEERESAPEVLTSDIVPRVGVGDGDASVKVEDRFPQEGGDDGDSEVPLLKHCEIDGLPSAARLDGSWLLDDFDDGDDAIFGNGLQGYWYSFGDGSTGQQTPDPWASSAGGLPVGAYGLHVVGGGFTAWGSIQAVTFATHGVDRDCLFDASVYDGFSFWLKGTIAANPENLDGIAAQDVGVLKVQLHELRTVPIEAGGTCDELIGECWNSYRYRAEPTACWKQHFVRFTDLVQDEWGQEFGELDTSQLYQFALEVTRYHNFDYWIDGIEFFAGEPQSTQEICDSSGGAAGAPGVENR